MIEISTSSLTTRKKQKIDGHEYTVRKLGAGEELLLSEISRKILAMLTDLSNDDWNEKSSKEYNKLKQQTLDIYTATFDDGGDQSKSRALIERLSDDERNEIYGIIFGDKSAESEEVKEDDSASEKVS